MLGLVNAFTSGNMDTLVNRMNACFVSINEDLPILRATHPIFDIKEPMPAKFTICVSPIYKYVDDSTIFEICNQDMVCVIQDSADLVEQWSCNNDMRINTNKTKEMVICFRRDRIFVDSLPLYLYERKLY